MAVFKCYVTSWPSHDDVRHTIVVGMSWPIASPTPC